MRGGKNTAKQLFKRHRRGWAAGPNNGAGFTAQRRLTAARAAAGPHMASVTVVLHLLDLLEHLLGLDQPALEHLGVAACRGGVVVVVVVVCL